MVKIKNINELAKRIAWEMEQHGPSCSLNHLDVSAVDDMGVLFYLPLDDKPLRSRGG